MTSKPTIESALKSPSVSYWLKDALRSALERDCVDAAGDARLLARILSDRMESLLSSVETGEMTSAEASYLTVGDVEDLSTPGETPDGGQARYQND